MFGGGSLDSCQFYGQMRESAMNLASVRWQVHWKNVRQLSLELRQRRAYATADTLSFLVTVLGVLE